MLFDKKIKYITEALKKKPASKATKKASAPVAPTVPTPAPVVPPVKGTTTQLGGVGQSIAGYQHTSRGLSMDEEKVKDAMSDFVKTHDPNLLNEIIAFTEGAPHLPMKFGGKWIKADELKDLIISRFFTKGKKEYINYPKDENGVVLRNVDFQREVRQNPQLYPKLHVDPVTWLKVLFKLFPVEASDRRQVAGHYNEKVPYFMKGGVIRSGRVAVVDGKVSPTPFGGRFMYQNKYQAFTPNGEPIPYEQISGGKTIDDFKKILHSAAAKAKM
jgi:hypothetical protein